MVIVMEPTATEEQIQQVIDRLTRHGFDAHRSTGATRTIIGAVGGNAALLDPREFELLDGVHEAVRISEPYKLAGRVFKPEGTVVRAGPRGEVAIGGKALVVMAGPCAVENSGQVRR